MPAPARRRRPERFGDWLVGWLVGDGRFGDGLRLGGSGDLGDGRRLDVDVGVDRDLGGSVDLGLVHS